MSKLEEKALESANRAFGLVEDMTWDMDKEFHNYHQEAFKEGYSLCQKEYEEKLRWIPIEEKEPPADLILMKLSNGEIRLGYFLSKMITSSGIFVNVTHFRHLFL